MTSISIRRSLSSHLGVLAVMLVGVSAYPPTLAYNGYGYNFGRNPFTPLYPNYNLNRFNFNGYRWGGGPPLSYIYPRRAMWSGNWNYGRHDHFYLNSMLRGLYIGATVPLPTFPCYGCKPRVLPVQPGYMTQTYNGYGYNGAPSAIPSYPYAYPLHSDSTQTIGYAPRQHQAQAAYTQAAYQITSNTEFPMVVLPATSKASKSKR